MIAVFSKFYNAHVTAACTVSHCQRPHEPHGHLFFRELVSTLGGVNREEIISPAFCSEDDVREIITMWNEHGDSDMQLNEMAIRDLMKNASTEVFEPIAEGRENRRRTITEISSPGSRRRFPN